jgi:hypothetical protein
MESISNEHPTHTSCFGFQHVVLDDELAAPGEQIGEAQLALGRVEDIFLGHLHPRQFAPCSGNALLLLRELLLFIQQIPPGCEPLVLRYDIVRRYRY